MRLPPVQRIKTCRYCRDFKGDPKPIMPENLHLAIRMPTGDYKCHVCQEEEIKNMISKSRKRRGITSQ